jgi:hypothetical protein
MINVLEAEIQPSPRVGDLIEEESPSMVMVKTQRDVGLAWQQQQPAAQGELKNRTQVLLTTWRAEHAQIVRGNSMKAAVNKHSAQQ